MTFAGAQAPLRTALLSLLLVGTTHRALAQTPMGHDFSGVVTTSRAGETPTVNRVHVGRESFRIEMVEGPIVGATVIIHIAAREQMVIGPTVPPNTAVLLGEGDVDVLALRADHGLIGTILGWVFYGNQVGWVRMGTDMMDGKSSERYALTGNREISTTVWIDAATKLPLRVVNRWGGDERNTITAEWSETVRSLQSAELFAPPVGFTVTGNRR